MNADQIADILMGDPSQEECEKMCASKWWEVTGLANAAILQLDQSKLCMPFGKFHEAVEFWLWRPVFNIELAHPEKLLHEGFTREGL